MILSISFLHAQYMLLQDNLLHLLVDAKSYKSYSKSEIQEFFLDVFQQIAKDREGPKNIVHGSSRFSGLAEGGLGTQKGIGTFIFDQRRASRVRKRG
jgi:hypothetical protein